MTFFCKMYKNKLPENIVEICLDLSSFGFALFLRFLFSVDNKLYNTVKVLRYE